MNAYAPPVANFNKKKKICNDLTPIPVWSVNVNEDGWPQPEPVCLVHVFKVGTLRAMLVCSLHYDAETLMLLYGFIAARGALSAAKEDYFKALCWLWNVKCSNHTHSNFQGESGVVLQKMGISLGRW